MTNAMRCAFLLLVMTMLVGCGPVARGNVELSRGDFAAAEASFLSILAEDPDNLVARRRLGVLYFDSGRYAQAAEEFGRIKDRDRQSPMTQIYHGVALVGAGREEEGFAALRAFRHPTKFRVTQQVRAEARQSAGTVDPRELFRRMERAYEEGERQEILDNRESVSRSSGESVSRPA